MSVFVCQLKKSSVHEKMSYNSKNVRAGAESFLGYK